MNRYRRWVRAVAWGAVVLLAGCAKKGPPSGGPPDLEPPRLIAAQPDSGAAGVALDATLSLTFSEGMEPRTTGDAVALAPRIEISRQGWSGHTLTLGLAEPLKPNHTYALFVSPTARDRHGNALAFGKAVVFTTAESLAHGELEGGLEARGFKAKDTYLWCYDAGLGHRPDSTARDFDALGLADTDGRFRVVGLPVPGSYRVWAFADLNSNRSFEPGTDILAAVDTTFTLTRDQPRLGGLMLRVVNPRAPGSVAGSVLDSLISPQGELFVSATCVSDSTLRPRTEQVTGTTFKFELPGGRWALRAFRDLDRDHKWRPDTEPASDESTVDVEPAGDVQALMFTLKPPRRGP